MALDYSVRLGYYCVTGVTVESIDRSQVFDNSQRNSLRGVVTGSLSVLPFVAWRAGRLIRAESPSALFVPGAPPILSMFFSSARKCIPIPAFSLGAQAHSIPAFSVSAQVRADPFPLFFGVQAQADPFPLFFGAQAQAGSVLLCPQEFTHVCTSQSQGERGPRPRAYSF